MKIAFGSNNICGEEKKKSNVFKVALPALATGYLVVRTKQLASEPRDNYRSINKGFLRAYKEGQAAGDFELMGESAFKKYWSSAIKKLHASKAKFRALRNTILHKAPLTILKYASVALLAGFGLDYVVDTVRKKNKQS